MLRLRREDRYTIISAALSMTGLEAAVDKWRGMWEKALAMLLATKKLHFGTKRK